MALEYSGTVLQRAAAAPLEIVRALQRDLRQLGYLAGGLDGQFGTGTERAVRALQCDLLINDGRASDGSAPVSLRACNAGRVTDVTGIVDQKLAGCIEDLLNNSAVPRLPRSETPAKDNARILDALQDAPFADVPLPFLLAVLSQESGLRHFSIPTAADPDDYITVGLDRNDPAHPDRITSRGYGVGQYTLFHHPPTMDEVKVVMVDPIRNVARARQTLREKFSRFIVSTDPDERADDRLAEVGPGFLRGCRHAASDPRFYRDCRTCAQGARPVRMDALTPLYPGSAVTLQPTPAHPESSYPGVPAPADFGCDWPYAVRRYNGSGMNSYHYQAQILRRILQEG